MLDKRNEFEDFLLSLTEQRVKDLRKGDGSYEDKLLYLFYLTYLTTIHKE